jgi:hypothetical protein
MVESAHSMRNLRHLPKIGLWDASPIRSAYLWSDRMVGRSVSVIHRIGIL